MQKLRILLGVVTTLATVSACNNPPAPANDAATTPDGGQSMLDSGHSTVDTGVPVDGGRPMGDASLNGAGTCTTPINLNTAGTALTTGTGRTIASNNSAAPTGALSGVSAGSCAVDGMGAPTATNEVVFSYTVQTGGHIVASTNDPASDATLDTIVWVLDACTGSAGELACNDDDGSAMTYLSTAASATTVTAGTTVFIVVAGYMNPTRPSTGAFRLNVSEQTDHAAGAACDTANSPFCVTAYSCQPDAATGTAGHCLADGALNGACRITGTACDTGLQCTETMPTADAPGVCQVPIATGGVCDADHLLCITGSTCLADQGSTTMGHCLADGSAFGACRLTGAHCDTGLTCSEATPMATNPGTCQTPIATGDVCTLDHHFLCVTSSTCLADQGSTTMGHCLADGSAFGACRLTGMICDTGLTCSEVAPTATTAGTCQMPIAAGGACTTDYHFVCVAGQSCQSDDGVMPAGHCLADGVVFGACRLTGTACDAALTCSNPTPTVANPGTCQMVVASGGVCSARDFLCVADNTCIPDAGSDTMGHCLVDGSMGGACRAADPACDGALVCDDITGLCG